MDSKFHLLPDWLRPDEFAFIIHLAGWLPFEHGRQGTGYRKAPVPLYGWKDSKRCQRLFDRCVDSIVNETKNKQFFMPALSDCWLIRYDIGDHIHEHTDRTASGCQHWRMNVLVCSGDGGKLSIEGKVVDLEPTDAYIFRPDITPHAVSPVTSNGRIVFSVGFLIRPIFNTEPLEEPAY